VKLLPDDRFARGAYFWLAYLGIPLATAAFAYAPTPRLFVVTALGIAACLPLYFWAFWLSGRKLLLPIAGLIGLGLATTSTNTGLVVIFGYAVFFSGRVASRAAALQVLAAAAAAAGLSLYLGDTPPVWIAVSVGFLLFGGAISVYFGDVGRRLLQAEADAQRLAVVAERERIARDLHDLLGHTLSVIVLKSELASKLAELDTSRAIVEIRDVERISRDALAEVRAAVGGYRKTRFVEELEAGRAALAAAGVSLDADVAIAPLDPAQEQTLALVLREAITNVVRHARATRCIVRLDAAREGVRLSVEDDGNGGGEAEGSGLSGMRARLAAHGGEMRRERAGGTRVIITMPAAGTPGGRGAEGIP
jgi:two-component system sensor histidine kinase DesK